MVFAVFIIVSAILRTSVSAAFKSSAAVAIPNEIPAAFIYDAKLSSTRNTSSAVVRPSVARMAPPLHSILIAIVMKFFSEAVAWEVTDGVSKHTRCQMATAGFQTDPVPTFLICDESGVSFR